MDNSEGYSAYIHSTFNNIGIKVADNNKNIVFSTNAEEQGFRASKKSSAEAANQVAELAAQVAKQCGIKSVDVYCKGAGIDREVAIRALISMGLEINIIKDITPVPHNGCRPKKRRVLK